MSIDTVVVLKIRKLAPPKTPFGTAHHVVHRGDCSLLHLMTRYHGEAADEHALTVRRLLGDALDAHDDPRGLLFFSDAFEPRGKSYEAIVQELGAGGMWGPKVGADHVPDRITKAAAGSFEGLVRRALEQHGAKGRELVEAMDVTSFLAHSPGVRPELVADYRKALRQVATLMGEAFAKELEAVLDARFAAQQAAEKAREARWAPMLARVERGEPLVSNADVQGFLASDGAKAAIEAAVPGLKEDLAKLIDGLDVDVGSLPDDDLGKQLARTLGIATEKTEKKEKKPAAKPKKPAPAKKAAPAAKRPRRK